MQNCENTNQPFQIITQCNDGYIGYCECCGDFNLAYKTLLLVFQQDEMMRLLHWIEENRNNGDFLFPFPHGRDRIYRSPISNLYLLFNEAELDDLSNMAMESKLILEARKVIAANQ